MLEPAEQAWCLNRADACHKAWRTPARGKREDYAFWRQFHEKPSIIPGCPGAHTSNDGEQQGLQCSSSTVQHIQQRPKAICQQEALQGSRALYNATPQGIQHCKVVQRGCLAAHQLQLLQLQAHCRCTLQTASACSVCNISSQCVSFRIAGGCSMQVQSLFRADTAE